MHQVLFSDVKHLELEAGATPWARQHLPMTTLAYETIGTTTAPVISAQKVAKINQWAPGLFARAAILPTEKFGLEARYLGLLEWKKVYAISTTGTSLTYSLQISPTTPISFTSASQVIEDYRMKYESGDLLFLWNMAPLYDKFFGIRALVGPSYIYLMDELDQTLSSATYLKQYTIEATNHFIGARGYAEIIGTPAPFIWGLRGSFGVYADVYRQRSTVSQSIPLSSSSNYVFYATNSWPSTLLQGDVYLGINLFDRLRIKGAFGIESLNYLGSALTQPGLAFTKKGIYRKNHFLFYGANVSIELDLF
jgi:hypothetical protein